MNNVIERLEKIEEKVSDHRAHILSMESKIDDRDSRLDRIESKIDSLIGMPRTSCSSGACNIRTSSLTGSFPSRR